MEVRNVPTVVSIQHVSNEGTRTLLALRQEDIVREVVQLIASRLPELVEQEPPEWLRLLEQEGEDDEDPR
jgi:hypothetical protein